MKILEYALSQLPNCPVIVLVGRRRSGKTVTCVSLMKHFSSRIKFCLAFVGSNASIKDYAQLMPASFIYSELDFDMLQRLIDKQNAVAQTRKPDPILVLIDDLAFDVSIFKSKQIRQLFTNGRHLNITLICTFQYLKVLPPICRANTDVVFATQEKSDAYKRALYENFSICFKRYREFEKVHRSLTTDYSQFVMVTCSGNPSDRVEDNIFWFKAEFPLPKFIMNPSGSWWKAHRKRFDPNGTYGSGTGEIKLVTRAQMQDQREHAPTMEKKEAVKSEPERILIVSNENSLPMRISSRFS